MRVRGGAARKGRRRNFILTDAQALPRSAPHPLATKVARSLTSTGAGTGGRGNWYAENPLWEREGHTIAYSPTVILELKLRSLS